MKRMDVNREYQTKEIEMKDDGTEYSFLIPEESAI
jgi:hypothetical protein